MLSNKRSTSTARDVKRKDTTGQFPALTHELLAPDTALDPTPDWIPLAIAPFRYSSQGYIRSEQEWSDNFRVHLERFIEARSHIGQNPEYDFQTRGWEAHITSYGMLQTVSAQSGKILFDRGDKIPPLADRFNYGDPDTFLQNHHRMEFTSEEKPGASWHKALLIYYLDCSRGDLRQALNIGSANIVARKTTILAPFQRISFDQWLCFKMDEPEPLLYWTAQYRAQSPETPVLWIDPRSRGYEDEDPKTSTATGPNCEKLYSIHVAPGPCRNESRQLTLEEKCRRWLTEMMTAFPDRSPLPRNALVQEAMVKFPGISERGVSRALFSARQETGNSKFLSSGRPPKSRR